MIGFYVFDNNCVVDDLYSNRSMLVELCTEFSSTLTNAVFEFGRVGIVIYCNFGVDAAAEALRYEDCAQSDSIVMPT